MGFARNYLKLAFQVAWPNVGHMVEDKRVEESFRQLHGCLNVTFALLRIQIYVCAWYRKGYITVWCAVLCSVVWRSLGRGGSAFRRTDPFFKTAYQICMRIYVCGIDLELEQGRVPRSEVGEIKKKICTRTCATKT